MTIQKNYIATPNEKTIDFWIQNSQNVLFIGHAGVGKTSMIVDAFKRNNLRYRMFSASTMDPWVDFIGIPKECSDEKGPFLDLIKPKDFRDDEVDAIFFDEFNRSHKKIRNAVMELIQFKSINGRKFPNLKIVWAAINPDDIDDDTSKYDVEPLDDAQRDRFHIQVELPYKPCEKYFASQFGEETATAAIEWWNGLDDKTKKRVSPRRLETVLRLHAINGNIRFALPPDANITKLESVLKNGSPTKKLEELLSLNVEKDIKDWLADENNYACIKSTIIDDSTVAEKTLKYLSQERISSLMSSNKKIQKVIAKDAGVYKDILTNITNSNTNKKLSSIATKILAKNNLLNPNSTNRTTMRSSSYFLANVKYNNIILQSLNVKNTYSDIGNLLEGQIVTYANSLKNINAKRRFMDNCIYYINSFSCAKLSIKTAMDMLTIVNEILSNSIYSTKSEFRSKGLHAIVNEMVNICKENFPATDRAQWIFNNYGEIFYMILGEQGNKSAADWIISL